MQENASLRAQVSQAEEGRLNVEKQLIETQSHVNEVICCTSLFPEVFLNFSKRGFSFSEKLFQFFVTVCPRTVLHVLRGKCILELGSMMH